VTRFPLVRDPNGDYSRPCACPPAGAKETHRYVRTLPTRIPDTSAEDILLDEAGAAILDEQSAGYIYDDLR
jgi:hypothetical protein